MARGEQSLDSVRTLTLKRAFLMRIDGKEHILLKMRSVG